MSELPLSIFPTAHIMTDSVLEGGVTPPVQTSADPIVPSTDPILPTEPTPPADPNNPSQPDPTNPDPFNPTDPASTDLEDYSSTALFVKLLENQGFGIYEELPKDLTPEQFVQDLPEFISTTVEERLNERLEKLGSHVEYFKLLDKGVSPEELAPAYQMQQIADFDINDPNVTEQDLQAVITRMHLLRGLTEDEASQLVAAAKTNNILKQEAEKSVKYHQGYINHIQQQALATHEAKKQAEAERAANEQNAVMNILKAGKIGTLPIPKGDQEKIYNTLYKQDQVVAWTDANGVKQQALASKWEVAMHQIMNDPEKLVTIAWLVANDFNISSSIASPIADNINRQILDALEKKGDSGKVAKPVQSTSSTAVVSRFAPQQITVGT